MSAPARAWATAVSASRTSAGVVVDRAVGRQRTAVAVVGVLAQARVGDRRRAAARGRGSGAAPPGRSRRRPTLRCRAASLVVGRPNRITPPTPSSASRAASSAATSGDTRATPGIEATGSRTPEPGRTKSGATSIDGWRRVSRTSARRAGVRRSRRGRALERGRRPIAADDGGASRSSVMVSPVAGGRAQSRWPRRARSRPGSARRRGRGTRRPSRPRRPSPGRCTDDGDGADVDRLRPSRGVSSPRTVEPLVNDGGGDRAVRPPPAATHRELAGASRVR